MEARSVVICMMLLAGLTGLLGGCTACSLMGSGEGRVSLKGDIAYFGLYRSLECTFEGSRIDSRTRASTTTDT